MMEGLGTHEDLDITCECSYVSCLKFHFSVFIVLIPIHYLIGLFGSAGGLDQW